MAINNGLNSPLPLSSVKGGTGVSSLTDGAVLVGNGSSPVTQLSLTDGQLLIGRTGLDPLPAFLSAGSGIYISNGSGSITISAAPLNYFTGFNHVFTTVTSMTFGRGECTSFDGQQVLSSGSAFTKTTAVWAQGNGNGGRPASVPLAANTSYATFIISTPAGVIDFGYDTSITATNLLAAAAGAGFTRYRRIGYVHTDGSSNIRPMTNIGTHFLYLSPVNNYYSSSSSNLTVYPFTSTPTQQNMLGIFFCAGSGANETSGFASLFAFGAPVPTVLGLAPVSYVTNVQLLNANSGGASTYILNTVLSQIGIRHVLGSPDNFASINTIGWIDDRSIF